MRISNELRVGIMFFVGLVLLVLLILTLTRWTEGRNTYTFTIVFRQAQGILEGAPVQVAGVEVGRVSRIELDQTTNKALVHVRIDRNVAVYRNYSFAIGVAGLVGERFVDIRSVVNNPGALVRPGSEVSGTTTPDINDVLSNANQLVNQLTLTANSLNAVVGDEHTQQQMRAAIANLQRTSASSAEFMAGLNNLRKRNEHAVDTLVANLDEVSGDLRRVSDTLGPQLERTTLIADLEQASANANRLTARLDNIARNADELLSDKAVSEDIRTTLHQLRTASTDLAEVLAQVKGETGGVPEIATNLKAATVNIRDATANVKAASADIPTITQPFKEIAPETAENIRQVSIKLRNASESVGGLVQQVTKAGTVLQGVSVTPEARVMALTDSSEHSRSDLNLDLRSGGNLLRLGATDIGKESQLNLQLGNRLQDNLWLRYGLVQSRFGLGVDYGLNRDLRLSAELFDPENIRANALVDWRLRPLGNDFWLTGGWYDLLDARHNTFGIGLTYRPE